MTQDHRSWSPPSSPPEGSCFDSEDLAAYLDGVLPYSQRALVERHLAGCQDCRAVVAETAAFLAADSRGAVSPVRGSTSGRGSRFVRPVMGVLALAAGILLAVWIGVDRDRISLSFIGGRIWPSSGRFVELDQLREAVGRESVRPLTGRLSGVVTYAPSLGRLRGQGQPDTTETRLSPDLRIAVANVERMAPSHGEEGDAALGMALLLGGQLDKAVAILSRACERESQDAACWNDLAVAHLARAELTNQEDDVRKALEASDRSLSLNPRFGEALFNRAIALERLSRVQDAIAAWTAVQQSDSDSPWANEARTHVRNLSSIP